MKNEIAKRFTLPIYRHLKELAEMDRLMANDAIRNTIECALDEYEKSLEPKRVPDLFHPGEYVKEEMKARGWNLERLYDEMGIGPQDVLAILNENFTIGTHEAEALERAFGSSAQEWLNLQATYNAGIVIGKMKAAEELAMWVEDKFGYVKSPSSAPYGYPDCIRVVALARKIKEENDG